MTPKLRIKLVRIGNVVVMQVLEQDERFIAKDPDDLHQFYAINGIFVRTEAEPNLYCEGIALRGYNQSQHLKTSTLHFLNEEKAQEYKDKIIEALEAWSNEWNGWDTELTVCKQSEEIIPVYDFPKIVNTLG